MPDEATGERTVQAAWRAVDGAEDGGGEGEGAAKPEAVFITMKFILIYKGMLRGNKSKAAEKQKIRLQVHPQIKTVWEHEPYNRLITDSRQAFGVGKKEAPLPVKRFGTEFLPLANKHLNLRADLDILLLEPLVSKGKNSTRADIDNKIKSLIDGLRMPRHTQEIPKVPELKCPSPLYCLLEDDSLIGDFSVKTDRLLGEHDDGVALALIEVTLRSEGQSWFGMSLPGHRLP